MFFCIFLKRDNFCDFLFIYLDGNPSKKGVEAAHMRLDFTKLCSFFVVTLVSESTSGLDVCYVTQWQSL